MHKHGKVTSVIIAGSARNDGDTQVLVENLQRITGWDRILLHEYEIGHYDYQHLNRDDDFLPLMQRLIRDYDTWLLVTPVYWYAMSGIMKVFFDRITDLLTIEKELGRQLRLKRMAAISTSNGNHLGDQFWLPFSASAQYLGMNFLGGMHTLRGGDQETIKNFIDRWSG